MFFKKMSLSRATTPLATRVAAAKPTPASFKKSRSDIFSFDKVSSAIPFSIFCQYLENNCEVAEGLDNKSSLSLGLNVVSF